MPKAKGAILRLALVGWLGLTGLGLRANLAAAATPPEQVLPDSTLFFVKIADVAKFREAFRASTYGQLWNDPALAPMRADVAEKVKPTSEALKDKVGVTLKELFELPKGVAIAAIAGSDESKPTVSLAIIADAGSNAPKMAEVLARSDKQAEQNGSTVRVETFQNSPLHIITPPEKAAGDDKTPPPPPVVWTQAGEVFFLGSDVAAIKDLASNAAGRGTGAFGGGEAFVKTQAKVGAASAQVVWFLDVVKAVAFATKAGSRGNEAQAQQIAFQVQALGLDGLKSVGGALTLDAGEYSSLTKTFFNAPAAGVKGLLKLFSFPPAALRPEPWVPATAASYQTFSWDLDNAYKAVEDLVNQFQPGMLNVLEQQLIGPEGGQPLSFQKDVFGPLGNRLTLIGDFKKPIKEDSQRLVLSIALDDAKAFQATLERVIELAHAAPRKRDFQGTTILDFELPEMPAQGGVQPQLKGPVSVAVAKDSLLITTDATLLEQVLRPGVVPLAESADYQTVAKHMPEKVSGMTFVRPDEQARLTYDMLKGGRFEEAVKQGMAASRPGQPLPEIPQLIDPAKLPDFEVFAKYLTLGGSYSVMDDDGFTQTGFSLRKANP
ncbi:hypothetical protein [Planctomyces sp. SH-PL62]|uniref:hypothetical protein n=1 Tax=Planctomyces sp. SH-PL62 TaxID=1636152 RepID=UPI00078C44AF|nr:hypothetical protein [Planctomyces sp. SH-PL62]AMV37551.1 hypothetical protein VT85_08950 [Planctomyces sp. SH-PL62]